MVVLTPEGLALIKRFEGCRLTAYQDQGGVWTIGYGQTGPDIVEGLTWSKEQANHALAVKLLILETQVRDSLQHCKIPLNDNQFSALVSFAYNVGIGAFRHSTLLLSLEQGQFTRALSQLLLYSHVHGKFDLGLAERREAERDLFLRK